MNTQVPKNGLVWKVATGTLALFLVTAGAMYGMVEAHASSPHASSLPRTEFDLFHDTVDHRLERIERKLDALLER